VKGKGFLFDPEHCNNLAVAEKIGNVAAQF
ncbi:MAG: hypothetical protein ACI832_001972, partial [Rheinheimera aquimaris]